MKQGVINQKPRCKKTMLRWRYFLLNYNPVGNWLYGLFFRQYNV